MSLEYDHILRTHELDNCPLKTPDSLGFSQGFSCDGKQILVTAAKGVFRSDCIEGAYLLSSDWTNPQCHSFPELAKVIAGAGPSVWSRDGKHTYVWVRERDGTSSIWQLSLNGDREKRVLHLTDPLRQFYRQDLDVDNVNFYFNIGDRQSDIWTMELKKQ